MIGENFKKVLVQCGMYQNGMKELRVLDGKGVSWVAPSPLNCKANTCISTADKAEETANEHTHIFCTDSKIASGTTGDCKCEDRVFAPDLEDQSAQSGSPSAQSGSPSVYSVYSMFLVALSTLSFLV
jgi:hypothetical protein